MQYFYNASDHCWPHIRVTPCVRVGLLIATFLSLVKCLLFAIIVAAVLITGVRLKSQVIDNELKESNEGVHIGVVGSLLNMVTSFTDSHPSWVKFQMASSLIVCWTVFYLTKRLRARVFYGLFRKRGVLSAECGVRKKKIKIN